MCECIACSSGCATEADTTEKLTSAVNDPQMGETKSPIFLPLQFGFFLCINCMQTTANIFSLKQLTVALLFLGCFLCCRVVYFCCSHILPEDGARGTNYLCSNVSDVKVCEGLLMARHSQTLNSSLLVVVAVETPVFCF